MSDTPRTDKLAGEWIACETVPASHARELERDNAKLRESVERLQKIASAFLGWHSDVINSGQRGEIVEAILAVNHILANASRQESPVKSTQLPI